MRKMYVGGMGERTCISSQEPVREAVVNPVSNQSTNQLMKFAVCSEEEDADHLVCWHKITDDYSQRLDH